MEAFALFRRKPDKALAVNFLTLSDFQKDTSERTSA